jgi:hypothetical protein
MFEQDVPISPFQRELGSHQDRQRLSLDASSLLRQSSSLESATFERKQQANRRCTASPLSSHPLPRAILDRVVNCGLHLPEQANRRWVA